MERAAGSPSASLARLLLDECPGGRAYALTAALALLFVLWLFPVRFLLGHGGYFERGDTASHVSGWLFYRADEWRFPLLHTNRLNYPEGTNVALTDSIPLLALILKPFARWLPDGVHYFGMWHGLARLGQALAAAFLVRALGRRSLAAALGAAAFGVTAPVLLQRMGHSALNGHAVLLLALGLYFRARGRPERAGLTLALLGCVSVLALLVHPYLMAMCYAVFVAALVDGRRGGPLIGRVVVPAAWSLAVLLGTAWCLGYSHRGAAAVGYGFYSMNLSGFVCGGRLLPCGVDATGGQYEGFAYLGGGVLLLLAAGVALHRANVVPLLRSHPGLVAVAVASTLFAVSNRGYLGASLVWSFELPPVWADLAGVFRASGRFAWVPVYLLTFAALCAVLAWPRRPAAGAVAVALALPLQWVDVRALRDRVRHHVALPEHDPEAGLAAALSRARHLDFFPPYGCGVASIETYNQVQLWAARSGLTLNTAFTPRGVAVPCEVKRRPFHTAFAADSVYVMPLVELKRNALSPPPGFAAALADGACVSYRDFVYCSTRLGLADWRALRVRAQPVGPADARELSFEAHELPSEVGMVVAGALTSAAPDRAGYLSLGPYLNLDPGRYRAVLSYSSRNAASEEVGRWELRAGGAAPLASGPLPGSAGVAASQRVPIRLDARAEGLEVRVRVPGGTDLRLERITFVRRRGP
jgi:hypothetical protein